MKRMQQWITGLLVLGLSAGLVLAQGAEKIVVDGSTTVGPIAKAFAEYYMGKHTDVNITVSESGSGNGAKSLINSACDVASMSRPMKDSERQAAGDAGVNPVEHIVAMDGIAVVVHMSNPLPGLTTDQLRDIYMGTVTRWSELGGPDKPIVVISRDTNSGTYETYESLVMKKAKMGEKVEYVGSNGAVRQRVLSTPGAIGYVGLAFTDGVKPLLVNEVEATPETIVTKEYPIARPLYMYTNGEPEAGSPLAGFMAMSSTPEGQQIIEEVGFVPLP